MTIDNIKVEVLPVKERAKYLGQTITFEQQETTEIKSRVRAAWASFTKYRLIEIVPTTTHNGHYSYTDICLWNMDPLG